MTTTTKKDLGTLLASALDLHARAKQHSAKPEDNPFHQHELNDLVHGAGILKGADQIPAKHMAEAGDIGYQMEVSRNEGLRNGQADKSAKRMAAMRARAAKRAEFDRIADSDVRPSQERMTQAWQVVLPLVPIVTQIANSKRRWAGRMLGSLVDDVPQVVLERMALVIAKSDKFDLEVLRSAADDLGKQHAGKGRQVPGDQRTDDERKEAKQQAKARKWLMGMINNRVQGALVDLYQSPENLRWENLDILTTVMATINGPGDDPMTARFKADRAPSFVGARFQRPGGVDPELVAIAINAAIDEKGLGEMVEILLDEENRRSNGSVAWARIAEAIFLASPAPTDGAWLWEVVCNATSKHSRPKRARADAARTHVRNHFEWLPEFIVAVMDAMNPHRIGWGLKSEKEVFTSSVEPVRQVATVKINRGAGVVPSPNPNFENTVGRPVGPECIEEVEVEWHLRKAWVQRATRLQAVMASDFELFYLGDKDELGEARAPLAPALRFATVEEAVAALTEGLEVVGAGA